MTPVGSQQLPNIPGSVSNSGAYFQVRDGLFSKVGDANEVEKLRDQMIWLASLREHEQDVFPAIKYGWWHAEQAMYSSDLVPARPAYMHIKAQGAGETSEIIQSAARWISGTLHATCGPLSNCMGNLVTQVERRLFHVSLIQDSLAELIKKEELTINGRTFPGPSRLLCAVRNKMKAGIFPRTETMRLHGDFHLGNLLVSEVESNKWWLVDPRGRFANGMEHFDNYYDWGKLFHDLYGLYNPAVHGSITAIQLSAAAVQLSVVEKVDLHAYRVIRTGLLPVLYSLESGRGGLKAGKLLIFVGLLTLGALPFHRRHLARSMVLLSAGLVSLTQGLYEPEETCHELLLGDFSSFLF